LFCSDEFNEGIQSGTPWQNGPVPLEFAITGLGPIHIRVTQLEKIRKVLEKVMLMREIKKEGSFHLFEMGEGGNGAQVIVEHKRNMPAGRQGYGTIHHAAFRVEDTRVLNEWIDHIRAAGLPTTGYVDRFFFESTYARVSPGILFEWATDGPGFMGDEPYETVGEILSLPPFLEGKREQIEAVVRPIDTVRSTIKIEKEYL